MRFDHRKACRRLAEVQSVSLTATKHVGGLHSFGECVLTTAKRFDNRKAFRKLAEVQSVCSAHRKLLKG